MDRFVARRNRSRESSYRHLGTSSALLLHTHGSQPRQKEELQDSVCLLWPSHGEHWVRLLCLQDVFAGTHEFFWPENPSLIRLTMSPDIVGMTNVVCISPVHLRRTVKIYGKNGLLHMYIWRGVISIQKTSAVKAFPKLTYDTNLKCSTTILSPVTRFFESKVEIPVAVQVDIKLSVVS